MKSETDFSNLGKTLLYVNLLIIKVRLYPPRISKKTIEFLALNPFKGAPLSYQLARLHPLRTLDYRIIYQIKKKQLVIIVISLDHRKEIYKKLKAPVEKKFKENHFSLASAKGLVYWDVVRSESLKSSDWIANQPVIKIPIIYTFPEIEKLLLNSFLAPFPRNRNVREKP